MQAKLGIFGTLVLVTGLLGGGYWYQQNQLQKVQKAALLLKEKVPQPQTQHHAQSVEINHPENLIHHIPFENRFALGNEQAKVTIIWFLDYQCNFCLSMDESLQKIIKTYAEDIRLEVRHFPLETHSMARLAAKAALAAGKYGKFWSMHRLLFAQQNTLDEKNILKLAKQLKIDTALFAQDLNDPALETLIDEDIRNGEQLGVMGTPALFINGRLISGAYPFNSIDTLVKMARDFAAEYQAKYQIAPENLYAELIKWGRTSALPNQPVLQEDMLKHEKRQMLPLNKNEITKGPSQAIFTLVAYMDFECEFCAQVRPTLETLLKKYPQELKIVFRNYPLHFHNKAQLAAQAAFAAAQQNKFWEFYNLLFTHQQNLQEAQLLHYAKQVGLNVPKFKEQMHSEVAQNFVAEQIESGLKYGVRGTPSFFINGRFLSGAQPLSIFEAMLAEDKVIIQKLMKAGTSVKDVYTKISSLDGNTVL